MDYLCEVALGNSVNDKNELITLRNSKCIAGIAGFAKKNAQRRIECYLKK